MWRARGRRGRWRRRERARACERERASGDCGGGGLVRDGVARSTGIDEQSTSDRRAGATSEVGGANSTLQQRRLAEVGGAGGRGDTSRDDGRTSGHSLPAPALLRAGGP